MAIAKQWVGVNTEGYAIPGLFILKPGAGVVFRKIGERKDDRLNAAEFFDVYDELLETPEDRRAPLRGGFGVAERLQFRAALGGGASRADFNSETDYSGLLVASIEGLYTFAPDAMIGLSASLDASESAVANVAGIGMVRSTKYAGVLIPFVSLPVGVGIRLGELGNGEARVGLHIGARIGLQFAIWPSGAVFLDAGIGYNRFGDDKDTLQATIRAGFSFMPL